MTTDQLSGVELARACAEHVMRWKCLDAGMMLYETPGGLRHSISRREWAPDRDGNAMLEVIAKMISRGYEPVIRRGLDEWECDFFNTVNEVEPCGEGVGDTIPIAICRAAIAAIMKD